MPFEFPTSPAAGTEHTEFGVDYVWDGSVWNLKSGGSMTDYVLKAGDTMTGRLTIQSAAAAMALNITTPAGISAITLNPSNGVHSGLLEFWDPANGTRRGFIGYGGAGHLHIGADAGIKWQIGGPGLTMNDGAGIHWGNTSAKTSHIDLSEGVCLYGWGSTSKFGFNVTSGTLGYCVENVGNRHCFTVGNVERFIINKDGAWNTTGHFRTGETDGLGIRLYGAAYIYKKVGTGMVLRRSANDVQWQTEMNDGSGTTPVATASMTTFKDMGLALPDMKDDAELAPFRREDEGIEGFDVAKVLTLVIMKIKTLEAKIETLTAQPRGRR